MVSADGNYVVFSSTATSLVSGQNDTNGTGTDLFLYHRPTGRVTLVSHAAGSTTTTGNDARYKPSISADGAYVAFESSADNLAAAQQSDPTA